MSPVDPTVIIVDEQVGSRDLQDQAICDIALTDIFKNGLLKEHIAFIMIPISEICTSLRSWRRGL